MKKGIALMAAAATYTGLLFGLVGCGEQRECVDGHSETYLMPIFNGKTTTYVPSTRFVCDEYAPEVSA